MTLEDTLRNTDLSKSFEVDVVNKDGTTKSYTYSEAKNNGLISGNTMAGSLYNTPVYKADSATGKEFTTDINKTAASVSLNKDTGKITVTAPSVVIQNETFKNQMSNALKTLSSDYKKNPDTKYSFTAEDGTTETKTIDDILEELNAPAKNSDGTYNTSSVKYLAEAAKSIENAKAAHKKNVDLTDEDVVKLGTVAIGDSVKDNTLQLVSDLPEADFFRNLETYDSETGTVQYKDIMENAWNKEKVSSEDMIALLAALEDYYKQGDFSDKEQYIKNTAMFQFLTSTQPEMSWTRDVAENVVGFLNGILSFATDLGTGTAVAVDKGIFQYIAGLGGEENDHYTTDYSGVSIKKGGFEGSDTPYELVDGKIGTVSFDEYGTPTYTEEKISGTIENPKTYTELARAVFKENQAVIEHYTDYLHGSQNGWTTVGYGITCLASLISAGNVLGEAAKSGTTAVINKIASVARGGTAESATLLAKGFGTIYKIAQGTGQGAKFVKVVLNITQKATPVVASVVGESFAEAIVGDTNRLVDVLDSKELSSEDKTYLMETFVGNAIGYGVGVGAGKALIKAGESTKGRLISARMRNSMYKIQNSVGDAFDNLILKIRRIEGDTIADKIQALRDKGGRAAKQADSLAATQLVREARREIYNSADALKTAGKTADEIEAALKTVDEKVADLQAMENALNSMQKRGVDIATMWVSDSGMTLKAATKNFYDAASKLTKAERAAGKAFQATTGAVSDVTNGKTIRLFSQSTTNYIKAQEKLTFIENYQKFYENAEKTQDIIKKLEDYKVEAVGLTEMIEAFQKSATPELLDAANQFIEYDKKWWSAFEDLRTSIKLTSQDELDDLRKSGLWGVDGADYAQTSRRKDLSEYTIRHRDGSSDFKQFDSYEQYMAGASGDFVDPMAQMQIALYDSANKYAYRQFTKSYNNLTGTLTTKVSGKETALVSKMKKGLEKAYKQNSERLLSNITENVQQDDMINTVVKRLKNKVDLKIAQNTAQKKAKELKDYANLSELDTVDSGQVGRYVSRLDDSDIDTLWNHYYPAGDDLTEDILEPVATQINRQFNKIKGLYTDELSNNLTLSQKVVYIDTAAEYAGEPPITPKLKRTILVKSDTVKNDPTLQNFFTEANEQARKLKYETTLKDLQNDYREFGRQYDITIDELNYIGGQQAREYVDLMLKSGSPQRAAIDAMLKYYGLEGSEDAARYFALSAFMDNKAEYSKQLFTKFRSMVEAEYPKMSGVEQKKIAATLTKGITRTMEEEYTELYHIVKELNQEAVHETTEKMLDEVNDLKKKIEKTRKNVGSGEKNIIAMRNNAGELEYYQTDPLLAGLVNFQASAQQKSGFVQAIYNANYLWSKLFRLGTTAINIKSMVSQTFRDPINMWVGTGAYKSSGRVEKELIEVFGDDVVNYLKAYEPEVLETLAKTAKETGEDVANLAVKRELDLGKALSPSATETYMYSTLRNAKRARAEGAEAIYDVTAMDRTVNAIDTVSNKLGKLNEVREKTLRNVSYANGLQTALKRGYSLDDARKYATYMMNEGTTNFTRMTNHLLALRDTVPYLGSAINGSKSFWRLVSLDPVGVMGRLTGGIIIPTVALTVYSLMDEENREVYKNIKEYQKEDNIVFVANGQVFSIPIPQEFTAFIAPWRQMVEGMYGASANTFFELAANDILGFSPIELSGFVNLDYSKIESSSPGFWERVSSGTTKMWSQLAPAPLKSAFELITGIDPYTGNKIDTSYTDIDENGNLIVKDYKSGLTAKALNSLFKSWGLETSAPVVQSVLGNIFGDASVDIADFVSSLIQSVASGNIDWSLDADSLSKNQVYNPFYTLTQRLTDPITVSVYDEAQSAWKAAVSKAYTMKDKLLSSEEWQAYITEKATTTDATKLKQLEATRKNLIEPYYNYIKTMVTNLQSNYGETLTPAKYTAVLSLMTMNQQTLDAGSYGEYLNTEEFKTARAQAIQTMIDLGFPSATGKDILGKYRVNSSGDITVETYHPLAILQLDDTKGGSIITQSKKQHFAVIRNLISDANLYDERNVYQKQIKAAYSEKDYDKAEELTNEYNEKLIRAVGDYIEQNTPESVLQGDALDYLRDYVIVPSSFQITKKGRYATALGNGAYKSEAFEEPYLKYIFNYGENSL